MATKLQLYRGVAEQTVNELTRSRGSWLRYLNTAGRLYKYSFPDQMLIYAQRPDAIAVAPIELWNETFERWVRRGAKGIALIDDAGNYPRLKYVFDVNDTEPSRYRARPVHLWELRQEHKVPVLAELARTYDDVDANGTVAEAFRSIAKVLAEEYYIDHDYDIAYRAESSMPEPGYDFAGSRIDEPDGGYLRSVFTDALASSVAYTLMSRCGLDAESAFEAEDSRGMLPFQSVAEFNTPDMVYALGTAVSELSEQVLRDVEIVIRKYERVQTAQRANREPLRESAQNTERSNENYDVNPYLQPGRGLSDPRHSLAGAGGGGYAPAGAVRANEESVSQRTQDDQLQPPAADGQAVSAYTGGGTGGEQETGDGDVRADEADAAAGQGDRSDGVDGGDEQPESAGGGNGGARADLRVDGEQAEPTEPPPAIPQKSIEHILSTSAISLAEVDSILRDGGNGKDSVYRIAARFTKGKSPEELTAYLRREYLQGKYDHEERESGKGYDFGNHRICAWFDGNGIRLAVGTTAKSNIHRVTIPWEAAAERISQLMLTGSFVDQPTFDNALDNERSELAGRLWSFYRDDIGDIPEEWTAESGGCPEDEAAIKALLDDGNDRQSILDRLEADVTQFNYDEHERVWHNPSRLLADMCEAILPPVFFPNRAYSYKRDFSGFITQDEIDAFLTHRSPETKYGILSACLTDADDKNFRDYLKGTYGLGGSGTHALGGADNSYGDYWPGKGITLSRGRMSDPFTKVNLNWSQAAKRVKTLIESGAFMSRSELDGVNRYERLILVRNINNFYGDLPQEYERPFQGTTGIYYNEYRDNDGKKLLDFNYPDDAEREAIRGLLDDPERLGALHGRMRHIFENTPADDRYYATRKLAFDALTEYRNGTYALFPGIERLIKPGADVFSRSGEVIDLTEDGGRSYSRDYDPRSFTQLSLFSFAGPETTSFPSAEEQREKIDQSLKQEAAEVKAAFLSEENAVDALLLDISDEDKSRIADQFTTAPRSREAAGLVREIYGGGLTIPLPQAIKRIAELVNDGKFAVHAIKNSITFSRIGDFYEVTGGAAREIAPVLGLTLTQRGGEPLIGIPVHTIDEYTARLIALGYTVLTEQPETAISEPEGKRAYAIGDRVWLGGREYQIETIADHYKQPLDGLDRRFLNYGRDITLLDIQSMQNRYPIKRIMYQANFEAELANDERNSMLLPLWDVPAISGTEPPAPEENGDELPEMEMELVYDAPPEPETLDFDVVAQTALERVMADADYAKALSEAPSRASLRNPCTIALESSVRDHFDDEPEVFRRYFGDDDFNDELFDFILKQSWERRGELVSSEQAIPYEPRFTDITDPDEIAAIDEIFPPELEPTSANPKLDRLISEGGTDYYLLHPYLEIEGGVIAALTVDVLSQIKERADSYVICADTCHLDAEFMTEHNIVFRKMPRDWALLPEAVQDKIRAFKPEYELQWLDSTQFDRDFEAWQGERQGPESQQEPQAQQKPEPRQKPKPPRNFRITDDHLGEGGAKTKYRGNILAILTLKALESENRAATPDEQEALSRYVGWGGLPQTFDPDNEQWKDEYAALSELLTPEEFSSARASTLNAHYTSPVVIKAIWETVERLGFKSGNVLEPSCGIGNFFGLVPESMRGSRLYGVELDGITARIAQKLYPRATIQEAGFENTEFPDAFFDLAVGNVPFGDYGVIDSRYAKHGFSIHNFFFAKSLDKVRPGGVVAFITSKYTMDERNPKVRKYLAERAELLGAVRLPNNAFLKNAGTETTMDILFLQKRDRPLDVEPEWVHLGLTENGIPVNRYFLDNPEMVLGTMGPDERMNNKYGRGDMTACLPIEGADLGEQLSAAASLIEGEYAVVELDDLDGVDDHAISADPSVKNFSYALVTPATEPDNADGKIYADKIGEGQVYYRENSLMYPVDLPAAALERIKGMIALRDCVHRLIELQLDDFPEAAIKARQRELSDLYDGFIAEFGLINSQANNRAFSADSAYYLLCSLEILNEDGNLQRKADMFTKRTIKQKSVITHVDTASEALAVSLGEKARVDMAYMSELTGKDEQELFAELNGVIFLTLAGEYQTADEFLSGDVRSKLRDYKLFTDDPEVPDNRRRAYIDNVEALTAAQPKDLEAGDIAVRLGATWIDPEYIQQFMHSLLDTSWRNQSVYQVKFHQHTGEWQVTGKGRAQYSDIPATVTYGTRRMNAYQIIDDTLNLRDVRVYDIKEDADGKEHRVLNKKETTLAQQKQEIIKQKFKDWIWSDPNRRDNLVSKYNEIFNSVRPREYDGSNLVFYGINPEIEMRRHQVNAAARGIYGGNELLAHVVGAGKTFTMAAIAMESKRLGLCHKSLFAVPNHLTEQWAGEFLRLYPSANILVATKKDFEMKNRKKFCARIATGDYDAVIIGHSQLEKIPLSKERQERLLREQLGEIEAGIRELKESHGERFSIKQLEKTKKSLELRLSKLLNAKQKDDVVTFEQLGVDRLFVDEAHNFKNLFLYTKMRNVAGLSTSEAQKSSDLFMKCRYMDELTDGKGVIFATGTPVSNSMAELYTMQRYLQYDTLEERHLTQFDAWASTFGETATSIELAPEGTGYRARTRFAKFHNLPELMQMFKDVADIQTADMLDLPVPDAKFETIVVEPSELQKEMVEELSERAAAVHNKKVDATVDNMLKITTDGRKIGLDQRLMNPLLPDFEGSKVNACTENVYRIWSDTGDKRLTQLVFCDFSTPNSDGRFNVYDDIKAKLIERGIPEDEIAFIHDADTEVKKKELFAKVRQGKVRVLFGSTFKLGAGTNVQDKLIAIHDADCPWRPADLEQRAGRIIRQGNSNPEVRIFRYATSGTFDSYLWQTVESKQKFIAQIMSSKSPVRSCEDVDETVLDYAKIKALCAGNPLIAEKMNLDVEVAKLRMLKSEHNSQHYRLEDQLLKLFPLQIASAAERIAGIEADIAVYAAQKEKCAEVTTAKDGSVSVAARFPGIVLNGVTYAEKEPAAKALLEACKGIKGREAESPIGEYMGFKLAIQFSSLSKQFSLLMRGNMTYSVDLGADAFGNISRVNHALDKLSERLEGQKAVLETLQKQREAAKEELSKPFPQEAELEEQERRLMLINAELNIDGDGNLDVMNDPRERDDEPREPDDEYDDDERDEPESEGGAPSREDETRTGTYGKARPNFLDSIRSYDTGKGGGAPGNSKSAEREI
jgi:N12 class adenine-specific DNA methylase